MNLTKSNITFSEGFEVLRGRFGGFFDGFPGGFCYRLKGVTILGFIG